MGSNGHDGQRELSTSAENKRQRDLTTGSNSPERQQARTPTQHQSPAGPTQHQSPARPNPAPQSGTAQPGTSSRKSGPAQLISVTSKWNRGSTRSSCAATSASSR